MIKKQVLFGLFILLCCSTYFSTYGSDLRFYHLNTQHGLSQNTINFIHQDQQGFFWVGTNGGLNKWNGHDFISYTHLPTDTLSIGQGRVNCIYEDNEGVLWLGTLQGGVSKFNAENNSFTHYNLYKSHNQNQQSISTLNINSFNNSIIIGTFKHGLYLLNQESNQFTSIKVYNEHNELLHNLSINELLIDEDSTLWIGHTKGVVRVPKQKLNTPQPSLHGQELLKEERILCIYRDSKDFMWFGTHQSGAFFMNPEQGKVTPLKKVSSSRKYDYSIIRDFKEDINNNLWIATGGNGINIIDKDFKMVDHYENELNNNYSLSSNITYCLYLDNNKNMWVGTYNGGLNYTNNHKQSFNHIRGSGGENDLSNNAILSMCALNNGEIMIGTDGDGISFFDPQERKFVPFDSFNNYNPGIKSVAVSIEKDNKDNVYIGTYGKGLFIYNQLSKSLRNISAGKGTNDLPSNNIWAININQNNTVWLGTLGNGISKYDPVSGLFKSFQSNPTKPNSLCDNYISCFLNDSEGQLWIGTENGGISILIDQELGIFKNFTKNDSSGLSSNEIHRIYEDSKQNIWVSTHDGGLCLYNRKTESFRVLTFNDGLLSNTTRSIIEDNHGRIWVGSNKGVSVLSKQNEDFIISNFTQKNGLQSNEFNINAVIKTQNDYIYMGGNNGFNFFHPDSIHLSTDVGPMVITKIETLFHNDDEGVEQSIISNKKQDKPLAFDYNLALISFEYALLDYTVPELNHYQYKLDGYDKKWIEAGSNRKVSYTNLDPGNYTFKVIGTNSLGIQNLNEASLHVKIHPPFWKEAWFITFSIVLCILLVFIAIKARTKAYREQEILLKRKVHIRTKELVSLNMVLNERSNEIKLQSEELLTKSEHLTEVNQKLESSYDQIEKQNSELEQHRNNLEQLVNTRTEQLERAKVKAEESDRLKMAFLANMSHEIRTPMNAIMGFSTLLTQNEEFSAEERKQFSSLINSNSKSLLFLIDDILDLSKIEANQLKIKESTFDFIDLIEEAVANWKVINRDNDNVGFILTNKIKTRTLEINSDQLRVKQIINNLIDNAFKFTSTGSVHVTISIAENKLICTVEDTGVGISDDEIPKIFDRFRKSDDYTSKEFRGAGLGLTISKKLATLINANLWVDSDLGKGSTFYFELAIN